MQNLEAELMATTDRLQARQLAWTRELIAIPTVNPYSGDSSAGSEIEGQKWFAEQCRALGARIRKIPVPEDIYQRVGLIGTTDRCWRQRDNVVAEWEFGQGGPTVILNDHMDTVGTDGMTINPFDPRVRDGRVYGRGASDSKGNLIVGLTALAALQKHAKALNGRIILESVVDEECNGAGAGTLACCLAHIDADFSICLDGISGTIHNGCNGIVTPRLTVYGEAGHAATGKTVNAIDKAFRIKRIVDKFAARHAQEFPGCRVNLGVFRSGTSPTIVPATAEMQLNIAYATEDARRSEQLHGRWNGSALRQRFEKTIEEAADTDPWFRNHPVKIEWLKDACPFFCAADDPYSRLVINTIRELTKDEVPVKPMQAWFDATHLARILGKPVLGIGSGTPGLSHGSNEYAELEMLYRGTRNISLSLYRLLSQH